ncbi:MAG: hypothetical protein WC670_08690 [Pseudolabrys sp.]|jgi:hypothetical protein
MRLTDIAQITATHVIGRLLRRTALFGVLGVLAIVTIYYASAAGSIALALQYGPIYAYLIMAGFYAMAAAIVLIVLWVTRAKPPSPSEKVAGALSSPRGMQITMLIEAAMLGYTLARKSGKSII